MDKDKEEDAPVDTLEILRDCDIPPNTIILER